MTKKSLLLSISVGAVLVGCQKDADTTGTAPATPGGPKKAAVPADTGKKGGAGGMSKGGLAIGGGDSHLGDNAKGGN